MMNYKKYSVKQTAISILHKGTGSPAIMSNIREYINHAHFIAFSLEPDKFRNGYESLNNHLSNESNYKKFYMQFNHFLQDQYAISKGYKSRRQIEYIKEKKGVVKTRNLVLESTYNNKIGRNSNKTYKKVNGLGKENKNAKKQ